MGSQRATKQKENFYESENASLPVNYVSAQRCAASLHIKLKQREWLYGKSHQ